MLLGNPHFTVSALQFLDRHASNGFGKSFGIISELRSNRYGSKENEFIER